MGNEDHGKSQAAAQYESIAAMVAAAGMDWDRLEELREAVLPYTAGWNMPGYLPDSEPVAFQTADEAREYLADEMRREADIVDEGIAAGHVDAALAETAAQLREAADALENLKTEKAGAEYGWTIGAYHYWLSYDASPTAGLDDSDAEELAELEAAAGEYESADDAEQAITDDPLSVEVRSGWHAPGDGDSEDGEFRILLCTGGPAVQIRGELSDGEPCRAWLEYQDWGTPWTQYFDADQDVLLSYARRFCFAC